MPNDINLSIQVWRTSFHAFTGPEVNNVRLGLEKRHHTSEVFVFACSLASFFFFYLCGDNAIES